MIFCSSFLLDADRNPPSGLIKLDFITEEKRCACWGYCLETMEKISARWSVFLWLKLKSGYFLPKYATVLPMAISISLSIFFEMVFFILCWFLFRLKKSEFAIEYWTYSKLYLAIFRKDLPS